MTTLTTRPYAGEPDIPAISALQLACDAVSQLGMASSEELLRSEFADPRLDPARDLQLWEDAAGRLIAFGQLWILTGIEQLDSRLMLWVDPAESPAERDELRRAIIAWADARLREAVRERGLPAQLGVQARDDQADLLALLAGEAFQITRYSYEMERSLGEPIAEPRLPAGYTLREVAGPHEAEQWVAMFNQSFIDHPGHHPWDVEQMLHYLNEPAYRQDLNIIAVAPDGTFAGFCWALIYAEANARSGRSNSDIDVLGTRRGHRQIGLGRALLLATLQRLKAAGMDTATLGVVSNNPTGALQLYESAGFQRKHTWLLHCQPIIAR